MFENRVFIIISTVEIPLINFEEILFESYNDLILSVNKTKTILKWDGPTTPSFYNNLNTKEGPYTIDEISQILTTPEWLEVTI
jgi:hypothetical protein